MTLPKTKWRGAVYHAPRVLIVPRIARTIKFNPAQDIGESHGREMSWDLPFAPLQGRAWVIKDV